MPEIRIVKQEEFDWSEEQKDMIRALIFQKIDGFREEDKKSWRKFWNLLFHSTLGELFTLEIFFQRHSKFHRLHFAMEQMVFKNQQRFPTFQSFRDWAKIALGHVVWVPGRSGGIVPIPKSVDYKSMDQDAFEKFHADWCEFIKSDYAARTLWPKVPDSLRAEMVENMLEEFEVNRE